MNETTPTNSSLTKPEAGMVQPRYGRYGKISGWDCIVNGMDCVLFSTRKKAMNWMKSNGYDVVG